MNLLKKGDTPAEVMAGIGKIAAQKARTDPRYEPIMLTLNDKSKTSQRTCGPDIFKFSQHQPEGSRRPVKTVSIAEVSETRFREWLEFVEDPETWDMYAYIPRTEHNMRWLATHLGDNMFYIDSSEVREEAEKIAETIEPLRDAKKDTQLPQFTGAKTPNKEDDPEKALAGAKALINALQNQIGTQKQADDVDKILEENRRLKVALEEKETAAKASIPAIREKTIGKYFLDKDSFMHLATKTNFNDMLKKEAKRILTRDHVGWIERFKENFYKTNPPEAKWWIHADYRRKILSIKDKIKTDYFDKSET